MRTTQVLRFLQVRQLLILGLAVNASACRNNDDVTGVPSVIKTVAGMNQQAQVGTAVATPPAVRIQDGGGNIVAGVTVRFEVVSGAGTAIGDSTTTDASGVATVGGWILGTVPGANVLRAIVPSTSLSITFAATALVGAGVSLNAAGQQVAIALVGQTITPAPAVQVLDSYGNVVQGTNVTFSVTSGGGNITGATEITNANGIAQVGSWTLGNSPGTNQLTATIAGGTTFTFAAEALSGAPRLTAASPTNQSGYLSFPVTSIPRVQVTDAMGNALAGIPVTFTVTSGDATVSGGNAVSDANGIAAPADWRLGLAPSSTVSAAAALGAMPISFRATGVTASFMIDVRFLTSMTADERDAFVAGARRWMGIITAHLPAVSVNLPAGACLMQQPAMNETVADLVIFAEVTPIDGVGGILGSASPCATRSGTDLTAVGTMQFDVADLPALVTNNQLVAVITHEMAHVLGFGTTWSDRALITDAGTNDPIFVGATALAMWPPFATALGYSGRPVPVESCGGAGTADSHWRKSVTCNGSLPVFGTELMTGYIEAPGVPMPLSKMTIATMQDLGYQVDYTQADPFAGHLLAGPQATAPPTLLNERLGHATWEVTAAGETRRLP